MDNKTLIQELIKEGLIKESLAKKTVEVLKNPKIGSKLSQAAFNLVAQNYSWQKISDTLDKVYREVGKS